MYYYKEELINIIKPDKPDPAAARVPVPLMPDMPNEHGPGLYDLNN